MPTLTHIPLTTSLLTYPLLHYLLTGPSPKPARYTAALKTTSTIHSLLIATLALTFLHRQRSKWTLLHLPPHPNPGLSTASKVHLPEKGGYPDDTHNPAITSRSAFGNAITAIEAGYLIQDTLALLLKAHLYRDKGVLDKTLLTHHITIATALLLFQYYISRSREAGIYIIVQFLLMNASTPILNLRWYLRTYAPGKKGAILATDVLFAVAFFAARVGLVWSVLRDYGKWHGMGAWEVYWKGLRAPCQLGTGALVGVNLGWWMVLVRNLVGRLRKGNFAGK